MCFARLNASHAYIDPEWSQMSFYFQIYIGTGNKEGKSKNKITERRRVFFVKIVIAGARKSSISNIWPHILAKITSVYYITLHIHV